jgi:hypothetical protein
VTPTSIVFQESDDPDYVLKRKALSAAFFKSKIRDMSKLIKQVTLDYID